MPEWIKLLYTSRGYNWDWDAKNVYEEWQISNLQAQSGHTTEIFTENKNKLFTDKADI